MVEEEAEVAVAVAITTTILAMKEVQLASSTRVPSSNSSTAPTKKKQ